MTDPNIPDDVLQQISTALNQRKKIQAIKIYRTATGASLKESKDFVEAFIDGHSPPVTKHTDKDYRNPGLSPERYQKIAGAVAAGQKIEAIHMYRKATGAGLKESKDFVEAMTPVQRSGSPEPAVAEPHATHPATKSSGCGSNLLMVAVVVIVVLVFM